MKPLPQILMSGNNFILISHPLKSFNMMIGTTERVMKDLFEAWIYYELVKMKIIFHSLYHVLTTQLSKTTRYCFLFRTIVFIVINYSLSLFSRHQGGGISGERAPSSGSTSLKYSQSLKDPTKDPKVSCIFISFLFNSKYLATFRIDRL